MSSFEFDGGVSTGTKDAAENERLASIMKGAIAQPTTWRRSLGGWSSSSEIELDEEQEDVHRNMNGGPTYMSTSLILMVMRHTTSRYCPD